MNTSALKAFAPAVRKQLMEAVSIKLDFALTATTPDYLATYAPQVRALRELAAADRKGLIERVAYTWFNRLAALRYLDARNWHPFHARVLMAVSSDDTLPELFTMARTGAIPQELREYVDVARVESIFQGRIPSVNPQGEVYRMLVLAACRFYHGLLPDVFERLDDETELLLPDDLLTQQSIAQGFRTEITDDDCGQVEVLGWLYQFYISEKKDQVMARKSAVPTDDIPAVTQLFTPHWIVRYLVENSLGRIWLLNRPDSSLRNLMPYYVETGSQTDFLRIERPQDIRLCDPAAGSGHMLTYAFDLFYAIYEGDGYAPSEIPGLILTHNIFGIEIDSRASQLAALALTLKAREKTEQFFQNNRFVRARVIELKSVQFADGELSTYSDALQIGSLFTPGLLRLLNQFGDAKNLGSLISPHLSEQDILFARGALEARDPGSNLFLHETHLKVLQVLSQAELLARQYDVVVANPPYMGQKSMNPSLKQFVDGSYPAGSADMYSAFILRNKALVRQHGLIGMITIPNWLFLESFAQLRSLVAEFGGIQTLIHNGRGLWGSDFGSCAFVMQFPRANVESFFKRLFVQAGEVNSPAEIERRFLNDVEFPWFVVDVNVFGAIPGIPFAYWLSPQLLRSFGEGRPLSQFADARQGLATADNGRFLRLWYEPSMSRVALRCTDRQSALESGARWFPYNKGGAFRKWYGNSEYVINWHHDGEELFSFRPRSVIRSPDKYFLPSITWSKVTISAVSFRLVDEGHLFDVAGCSLFTTADLSRYLLAGFLNSPITRNVLSVLSPTMNYEVGHINKLPVLEQKMLERRGECEAIVTEATAIARDDWDSNETSWDFTGHPFLRPGIKEVDLEQTWDNWQRRSALMLQRMQDLETRNNESFLEIYGLKGELSAEVTEDQITLRRADRRRDFVSFLSYAVGCMVGRYSVDSAGLILAEGGDTMATFYAKVGKPATELTFIPDEDAVIPVLDGDWFADDVFERTREFLRISFGESSLRSNIQFLEESLGRDLRSYYLTDFYKDHLQTYKKRPVYWMVQSPRKGFSVLIYLHRYTRDTMNVILNRYLRDYQVKLTSRIDHLAVVQTSVSASIREKTAARKESEKLTRTVHECQEWERQTILPLAQARIELDLDDGVKVNYLKLGEALAPIPGLAAAED